MGAHKVQFTFGSKALDDLDILRGKIDAPSRAETIRYALKIMQWLVDETDKGHKICLETDQGIREVVIPFVTSKQSTSL